MKNRYISDQEYRDMQVTIQNLQSQLQAKNKAVIRTPIRDISLSMKNLEQFLKKLEEDIRKRHLFSFFIETFFISTIGTLFTALTVLMYFQHTDLQYYHYLNDSAIGDGTMMDYIFATFPFLGILFSTQLDKIQKKENFKKSLKHYHLQEYITYNRKLKKLELKKDKENDFKEHLTRSNSIPLEYINHLTEKNKE